ncbi:BQ2448_1772 [Microbotryum intermedium]|uniref:Restriction of telomere capping protein 4 n=1 Tax=Microbotryum intermedium TaxID=269621 RepID=A0A238FGV6_9BASI|nr:BQ2448_1772 [Microbotryum intermedium]
MESHARNYRNGAPTTHSSSSNIRIAAPFKPPRPAGSSTPISIPTAFGGDPHTDRNGHRTPKQDGRFSPQKRCATVTQQPRGPLTSFQSRALAPSLYRATPPPPPRLFSGRTDRTISAYDMDDCTPYDARAEAAKQTQAQAQARMYPFASARTSRNGAGQGFRTERRPDKGESDSDSIHKLAPSYDNYDQYVFDNDRQVRIKEQKTRDKQKAERELRKERQLALAPAHQADEKKRAADKLELLCSGGQSTVDKPLKARRINDDDPASDVEAVKRLRNSRAGTPPRRRRNEVDENVSGDSFDIASAKSARPRSSTSQKSEVLDLISPEKPVANLRAKDSQRAESDEVLSSPSLSPVKRSTASWKKMKTKKKKNKIWDRFDELSDAAAAPTRISWSPSPPPAPVQKLKVVYDLATLLAEEEASVETEVKLKRARAKKRAKVGAMDDADTSESDSAQSEEDRQLVRQEMRIRRENQASPDPLLEGDDELPDPSTLCPFCSSVLPPSPTKQLSSLKKFLLSRPNLAPNPSKRNPLGKRLPVVETASFCRRHRWETSVIPEGKARGWPTTIDWDALPKRVGRGDLSEHLSQVIMQRKPSRFLDIAKKEWEAKGSKINNILSEFKSSEIELPGYYGLIGQEKLIQLLSKLFVVDAPLLTMYQAWPLDVNAYIRRVLVPETAVELIRRDLKLDLDDPNTRGEAERICQESREYGQAMFSTTKEEEKEMRADVLDEQRQKARKDDDEKEKELQRRMDKEKNETKRRKEEIAAQARRNALRLQRSSSVDLGGDSSSTVEAPNGTGKGSETAKAKRKPRAALQREQKLAANRGRTTTTTAPKARPRLRGSSEHSDTDSDGELIAPMFASKRTCLLSTSPPRRVPRKKLDFSPGGKKRERESGAGSKNGKQPALVLLDESSDDLSSD